MGSFERRFLFPLLTTRCPHCHEVTKFGLTEQVAYLINIFGIGIGRNSANLIMCGGCGYKEFVQNSQFSEWKELGEKFRQFSEKEIEREEFTGYLQELELPELRDLLVASTSWRCECGEENPPNFFECWKCGVATEREPTESVEKPLDQNGEHVIP